MKTTTKTKQRGVVALLAVIFVSMAMLAIVFGMAYDARNVQDATLTTHKVTQAQARAWKGAEVVRLGLQAMSSTNLNALQAGALEITGLSNITATVLSNTSSGAGRKINVRVRATGADATATSTLNLVYLGVVSENGK